jgi:SP family sugar:H+ symporter-like MFS transporter
MSSTRPGDAPNAPWHGFDWVDERPSAAPNTPESREATIAKKPSDASELTERTAALLQNEKVQIPPEQPIRIYTVRTLLMSILVSMGGLIFGYGGIGQIGGFLAMQDYNNRFGDQVVINGGRPTERFELSDARAGTIVGLLMVGALVGALVAAPITDRFGRRNSITLWASIYVVGQIVEITTMSKWHQLVAGRLIEGFGVGALSVLTPMYQSETAPRQIRGALIW